MFVPNTTYELLTPSGFRGFAGIQCLRRRVLRVYADEETPILVASASHQIHTPRGYLTLDALELGEELTTTDGTTKRVTRIEDEAYEHTVYDPIDVEGFAYQTNDVVSHNCSFQGSANTLIPAYKLSQMAYHSPVEVRGDLKIYAKPIRADAENASHVYLATVDVSQGQEQDYSVISVFDASVTPFRQVAVYRKNNISPQLFAPVIRDVARHYCNAFVLVEINDVGLTVADMLHSELEYENLIYIRSHPKRGQMMGGSFNPKSRLGIRMTQATKRIGCAGLRAMIEKDQLVLTDYDTIHELTTFVLSGSKYEASPGKHDDTVMTLVLLGWLTGQQGFEDYIGLSMRKALMNQYEPVTLDEPFAGIFDPQPMLDWSWDRPEVNVVSDDEFWKP